MGEWMEEWAVGAGESERVRQCGRKARVFKPNIHTLSCCPIMRRTIAAARAVNWVKRGTRSDFL